MGQHGFTRDELRDIFNLYPAFDQHGAGPNPHG